MAVQQNLNLTVNFTGCSGIGKTTLAKHISDKYGLPFVSGSYSDLVPETKSLSHTAMIGQDADKIFEQDIQVLNLRKRLFENYKDGLVSDRSYIDSAAYMIQKLSHRLPECEIDDFIEKCRLLTLIQCDKVIFLDFTLEAMKKWEIEDNNKRIKNRFYQSEISCIIWWILNYWGSELTGIVKGDTPVFTITGKNIPSRKYPNLPECSTDILVVSELNYEKRIAIIDDFIKNRY